MGLTRLVAESVGLLSSIVLARLIAPDEFGRTAAALFLGILATAVSQQGVGSFLVAHKAPTRAHFEAGLLVAVVAGTVGTALMLLFAFTLAPHIFGSRTAYFVALASPTWILAGVTAVPIAQLQRRLAFGRLGVIEASASLVFPAVAISLAATGLNGEALILASVAAPAVGAAVAWSISPARRPRWHAAEIRELFRYGLPTTGSSLLYAAIRNVDYLVLAAFVPAFQVGLYMRAFALGSGYQSKISQVLLTVAFPVLSRSADLAETRRMRARMVRVHATVLFPLLLGLIAVAPEFVPWMYGERWGGAASLTQILAVGGMLAAIGTGTGPLLMATGHTRSLLVYNLIGFATYTASVLAAVPFGVTAVCIAGVACRMLTFGALQYLIVERKAGIPFLETVRDDVLAALTAGVPQLLVTMVGMRFCLEAGVPTAAAIALPGAVGLVVYAALLRALFPATWADLAMLAGRLVPLERLYGVRRRVLRSH